MQDKAIIDYLERRLTDWKASRYTLSELWSDAWAEYAGTARAYEWLRKSGMYVKPRRDEKTGDIETDWKHRIHTGKVFELTEILWAYFMQATFSTSNWLRVKARDSSDKVRARVIQKVMINVLKDSKFRIYFGTWLRQLIVTGTSVYRPSWCKVSGCLKHEVISNHRVYLNPHSTIIDADMFISTTVNRAWLKANMSRYNKLTDALLKKIAGDNSTEESEEDTDKTFHNVDTVREPEDNITIYEYYGKVFSEYEFIGTNCYAVMADSKLIHFEEEKHNDIIACNFIQLVNMPYGVSPITSSLGLAYADRSFLNLRLDNLSSLVNNVIEYVEDQVLDPEFKYFPGAKIPVKDKGVISSIPNASPQFPLSYQEEQSLDSRINRNVGTIPTVGTGAVRKAERVTAEEISASRQVGGTRINQYYQDMEAGSINRMLTAQYKLLGKYGSKYIDTFTDVEAGEDTTLDIDLKFLCAANVRFSLEGSEAVLTEQNEISKLIEFATFAGSNELLAQQINWQEIVTRIADLSGFEDPELLLNQPQEAEEPELMQPQPEEENLPFPTKAETNAIQANVAADGGVSAINDFVQGATING